MLNQADSVEMESESMASSTVKAAALKAVERKEYSILRETPTRRLEQGEDRGKRCLLFGAQVVRDGLAGALGGDDITNDGGLDGLGAPGAW